VRLIKRVIKLKMSTKGRYGLRAILDLAIRYTGEQIPLNVIAQRQDVSENYLEQVFSILKKSGLVISVKGSQGGYMLAKRPEQITIKMVLQALEGDISLVDSSNTTDLTDVQSFLNTYLWNRIDSEINMIIEATTLEDLVHEYQTMNESDSIIYYI